MTNALHYKFTLPSHGFRTQIIVFNHFKCKISIPSHESDLFYESLNENTTLHVPASSLDVYKITEPWSSFRNIVVLTEEEMGVKNSEITNQESKLIHDLRGHRVDNPTKGDIYIVGGRKKVW